MKTIIALTMALGISSACLASELNQNALETLLSARGLQVEGDVHSDETVESIYNNAVESNARINNECTVINKKVAKCILWLTFSPIGEAALEYEVLLPGNKLSSNTVNVSRGD